MLCSHSCPFVEWEAMGAQWYFIVQLNGLGFCKSLRWGHFKSLLFFYDLLIIIMVGLPMVTGLLNFIVLIRDWWSAADRGIRPGWRWRWLCNVGTVLRPGWRWLCNVETVLFNAFLYRIVPFPQSLGNSVTENGWLHAWPHLPEQANELFSLI